MAGERYQAREGTMIKPTLQFEIFWAELQAMRHGFFSPSRNFMGFVRTFTCLCDKYATDDLLLAIYRENIWNF